MYQALSDKFDELRNLLFASSVRVQACEALGTAQAVRVQACKALDGPSPGIRELNVVKADAGLTAPLFKANMANIHALTKRLTIERYNTLYYSDQHCPLYGPHFNWRFI